MLTPVVQGPPFEERGLGEHKPWDWLTRKYVSKRKKCKQHHGWGLCWWEPNRVGQWVGKPWRMRIGWPFWSNLLPSNKYLVQRNLSEVLKRDTQKYPLYLDFVTWPRELSQLPRRQARDALCKRKHHGAALRQKATQEMKRGSTKYKALKYIPDLPTSLSFHWYPLSPSHWYLPFVTAVASGLISLFPFFLFLYGHPRAVGVIFKNGNFLREKTVCKKRK